MLAYSQTAQLTDCRIIAITSTDDENNYHWPWFWLTALYSCWEKLVSLFLRKIPLMSVPWGRLPPPPGLNPLVTLPSWGGNTSTWRPHTVHKHTHTLNVPYYCSYSLQPLYLQLIILRPCLLLMSGSGLQLATTVYSTRPVQLTWILLAWGYGL